MRTISNTVVFENMYRNVPAVGDPDIPPGRGSFLLKTFSERVLHPGVAIVTEDCGTLLGTLTEADDSIVGKVPINDVYSLSGAGDPVDVIHQDGQLIYADDLLTENGIRQYYAFIRARGLESCTAYGPEGRPGVCAKCLRASSDYAYKLSFPDNISDIVVDVGYPKFWYLENVVDGVRQTYLVYYHKEGQPTPLPYINEIHEADAVDVGYTTEPIIYIPVETTVLDDATVAVSNTVEAINAVVDINGLRAFEASSTGLNLLIKSTLHQTALTTNPPYNLLGHPYAIPDMVIESKYRGFEVNKAVKISDNSILGFYSRLIESYGGSMVGLSQISAKNLPFREELIRNNISDNDVTVAFRELASLGLAIPLGLIDYIKTVPDRLDKALLIIAVYSVYTYIG